MRTHRKTIAAALATALAAGMASGAVAQDDGTDTAAPAEFTVKWAWGPGVRSDDMTVENGITTTRGGAWRPGVISAATDPRLEGTVTIAANSDQYPDGLEVWNYAFRVENEDGAWQQLPAINVATGSDDDLDATSGVMIGEGAYDGLIAVFDVLGGPSSWTLHGYIIDGELTPDPEPMVSQ